jgi:hypothetical protein
VSDGVHDNWLYAHTVDHERCRVVLHTVYPHVEPPDAPEWTDVVFDGVVVHHFQELRCGAGPDPACVLFDVGEADALEVLGRYADLLARCRNYGWPVPGCTDLDDLVVRLTAGGARCFEVRGVCGIEGFVFAASMELHRRASRAEV